MPRRYVIVLLCFLCLLICYVLRTSLSTAIIFIRRVRVASEPIS